MAEQGGTPLRTRIVPRQRVTMTLVGCWLLFFAAQILDTGGIPFERDLTQLYIPLRFFLHAQLKSGHLPQWFPYELIGVPFTGQIVTATFHPQTLLFLPFSPLTAVKWNLLVAYLLGAAGGYRFARATGAGRTGSVAAGLALAFGGYGVSIHNNPPYLMGMMTLPWVGWRALRLAQRERLSDAGTLAIPWALVFLGGDIQGTGFAFVLVVAALLAKGRSGRAPLLALFAGVLALLLMSVELLPATKVFEDTFRLAINAGDAPARVWATHPLRLLEFVLPGFLIPGAEAETAGHLWRSGLWATSVFLGAVPVALALSGLTRRRQVLAFAVLAVIGLWMALGTFGGLLPILFRLVPPLSHFAHPEKYLGLFSVACVPLVAGGFERALEKPSRFLLSGGAVAIALVVAMFIARPGGSEEWATSLWRSWQLGAVVSVGLVGTTAAAFLLGRRYPALAALPVAICFLELWRANSGLVPQVDRKHFERPNAIAERVRESAPPDTPIPRVAPLPAAGAATPSIPSSPEQWMHENTVGLKPDAASVFGIGTIGLAFLPALPARMLPIAAAEPTRWSRWLRACWRTLPANVPPDPDEKVVLTDEDANVTLVHQPCFPYAYAAGALSVESREEALARLNQRLPSNTVVWEGGNTFPHRRGHVEVQRFEPGAVDLTVDAEGQSAVVITEGFSPGWSALVDGVRVQARPTSLVATGVEVAAGHHQVRFEYRTPRFALGASLSALGLLLVGLTLWAGKARSSPRRQTSSPAV